MKYILITILLLSSLMAQAQITVPTSAAGKHKLFFGLTSQAFDFTLSDVTKTDTVGFEQMIVPENIKPGERYIVSFKKIETAPPVVEKIDGESAKFLGTWIRTGNNAGWHQGTIAYSNVPGSTVEYTFTGTKIELYAEVLPTHGTGTITLNGTTTQVSFKGVAKLPALIYSSPTLLSGTYTLKLTVGSGYSLVDYFLITK